MMQDGYYWAKDAPPYTFSNNLNQERIIKIKDGRAYDFDYRDDGDGFPLEQYEIIEAVILCEGGL